MEGLWLHRSYLEPRIDAQGLSVCLLPPCLPFCVLPKHGSEALRLGAWLRS